LGQPVRMKMVSRKFSLAAIFSYRPDAVQTPQQAQRIARKNGRRETEKKLR